MRYDSVQSRLVQAPRKWLVTGVAGFIGSNLLQKLLQLGQQVVGLDNFSTGYRRNLEDVRSCVSPETWGRFRLIEGDIRDLETCRAACEGVDAVLHQAAMGSVPRSIDDPLSSHASNLTGFLNMLVAAKDARVENFVYASSSSVYGDEPDLPKREGRIGMPLSPYAATKLGNEIYAQAFAKAYGFRTIGLRYFNVFGPRQDPDGAYAAVIPHWFAGLIQGKTIFINGDGETSRDFCYIDNCVQANLLAGCSTDPRALDQVYNVAVEQRTTLNELFLLIRGHVARRFPGAATVEPIYRDFRPGDVRHSLADIGKARRLLGYEPRFGLDEGLAHAADWYLASCAARKSSLLAA